MPLKPTRETVTAAIATHFHHEHFATILSLLDQYGVKAHEQERERVQAAILKLSAGNVDGLLHYLAIAKADYRDVLYWAEYHTTAHD